MIAQDPPTFDPLRVLLISPLPPPSGGIGRWAVLLLDWVARHPNVAVRSVNISPHWRAVEDMKLWKRVLGGGMQGLRDAWRILIQFIAFRPDVLHLNTSAQLRGPWDTAILAMAALGRVRSVYHLRMGRLPEIMSRNGWEWWGLRGALQLADQVVVLDLASQNALKHLLPAGRVVRLPNAIPLPPVESGHEPPTPPTVLYLGHVIPTKGMRELMAAWREIRPHGWRLRLAGQGGVAYQNQLLDIVGPEAMVEFLGDLLPDAAWREMQAAEVFVLPTYTEGFPNVILEAMAAGKAIVSTRVGAIAEMLDADGESPSGLVIQPRDAGSLANALRQLLSDAELRETLGARARGKVTRCYSTDVVFRRLLDLWDAPERQPIIAGVQSCSLALK